MTDLELIRDYADKGVGKLNVEAKLGRKMDSAELVAFRSAAADRQLRLANKKARGPKSVAERVREHVAKANEIGDAMSLNVRHRRLKAYCRTNLEAFGWYYCRRVLKHRASKAIRDGLIKDIQDAILNGGQSVKEYGRGTGKTTWIVDIAITWAVLYGHRRYPVIISATGKLAKKNLKTIKRILTRSDAILADFPEIAYPLRQIGDVSQRATSQTYQGTPTDIEWSADQIVLPMIRDFSGAPVGPGCGAIVGSVGIGCAVRGANEGGQRPDYLVFDDPQTKKIAHSPAMVADTIEYIHNDALMLAGHDNVLSAFVTITPQCYGDVATELTSQSKHPEWSVSIEPFISHLCPNWNDLVAAFVQEYIEDAANHDFKRTRSTAWYRAHRAEFASVTVIDDKQFDPVKEVDVIHHMLNLRAKLGERAFNAEIMMQVADVDAEISINADLVSGRVNGVPRGICPPGTDSAVAFCDINIRNGKGLSWGVVAFGPGRIAACVAYGRYPERGSLVPPNTPHDKKCVAVGKAMCEVIRRISALRLRDTKGRKVGIRVLGFDRGFLTQAVDRTIYTYTHVKPHSFSIVSVRGVPWKGFGACKKSDILRRGDHMYATRVGDYEYLSMMAPYWREIMQSGFLETPLMPGSFSFYGTNPVEHFTVASEICAEKLVRKYVVENPKGRSETAWDWAVSGENHYCDVFSGCFALASWYHYYDNLSSIMDPAVIVQANGYKYRVETLPDGRKVKMVQARQVQQDDLFDAKRNEAIGESYAALEDETEGTGETLPPLEAERDNTADPLLDASSAPPPRRLPTVYRPSVHKSKRRFWVK